MNLLNLRKYIFSNITVLWFYFCLALYIVFECIEFEPTNHNVFPTPQDIFAIHIMFCFLLAIVFVALTFLEILIRKYLIKKDFPKLNLKIPKFVETVYNTLFVIGFLFTSFLFVISIIFFLIAICDNINF